MMPATKCDRCGKFIRVTFPVYGPIPQNGPSHDACEQCHPDPALVGRMANRQGPPTACERTVTPDDDALEVIAPGVGRLIVDCEVHGELGSIPAGGDEYARLNEFWSDHVAGYQWCVL